MVEESISNLESIWSDIKILISTDNSEFNLLSNEKLVWSWGNNRYGQLGLGDKSNISLPKPITFLFEYTLNKFESVSCGGFHSLCLIKHNEDINWIEDDFNNIIYKVINEMWNN